MVRFVKHAVRALAVCIYLGYSWATISSANAAAPNAWINTSVVEVSRTPVSSIPYSKKSCSGEVSLIPLEGRPSLQEGCVYGEQGKPQIARYVGSTGVYVYAVKFPLDTKFVTIKDICLNAINCAYGQAGDVFLMRVQQTNGLSTAIVPDFTKHLVKYTDDGVYFRLEYSSQLHYISMGSHKAITNVISVSSDGKWGLVELPSYGFVRINLMTLEQRRVVAPGVQYGYGGDPIYETTISDDGAKIAIAGWRGGIRVYEIEGECGDRLTEASETSFSPYTYACPSASIDTNQLFPRLTSAHVPRFSSDNTRLSVYVYAGSEQFFATIAPVAYSYAPVGTSYVAFGDSFTSGEGELSDVFYLAGTNTDDNRCHVSSRSYPYLLKAALGGQAINRACSGARIPQVSELMGTAPMDGDASSSLSPPSSLPPSPLSSLPPSHISISVGGNDINLIGKLKTCLGIGTCEWAKPERRRASQEEIRAQFSSIVDLLRDAQRKHPSTAITLVGYPSVVNVAVGAPCDVLISSMLNGEERRYMDESLRYLNRVLRAAAMYAKVTFVDVEGALEGERLCDPTDTAMNGVRLGDDIAPMPLLATLKIIGAESFHPTPRGHRLVANAFQAAIDNRWWTVDGCASCIFTESQLLGGSYWSEEGNASPLRRQTARSFLSDPSVESGQPVRFSFTPGSFLPGTTVRFEIHSVPQELTTTRVDADGSVAGALSLPPNEVGYHTIHAYGQLPSGEEIDVYETIEIHEAAASSPAVADIPQKPSPNSGVVVSIATDGSGGAEEGRLLNAASASVTSGAVLGAAAPEAPHTSWLLPSSSGVATAVDNKTLPIKEVWLWTLYAVAGALVGGVMLLAYLVYVWRKAQSSPKL